jgi:hypothetical protein
MDNWSGHDGWRRIEPAGRAMTCGAQVRERAGGGGGVEADMRDTRANVIGWTTGVAMDSQDG